jgi:predicted alpha/beta hydrolase family esterase
MNARIQRLQVLLRLLLAAGLLAWLWPRQGPPAALAWAALGFWGYGLVMLLGFLALPWINRHEPASAPALPRLLWAWWREFWACERVFAWQQPFRAAAEPDHLPAVPNGQRGVLLLHGYSCNRGLWNGWIRRLRARGHACIALTLEPAFGSIDAYADDIEAALRRLERSTGRAPLVVAHSMGGLALRAWWRRHGDGDVGRLHRGITLGTPHAGTVMAALGSAPNARQMRRAGAWLAELGAAETPALRARLICYYSNADQVVCPAGTAALAGAEARHKPGLGHLQLVFDPGLFAEVLTELDA